MSTSTTRPFRITDEIAKTADYTVTAADNGKLFTTAGAAGAVAFTLPTLSPGLAFTFFSATDNSMSVVSAAGNDIITFNDVAASSVAFSTSGNKAGACVHVRSNEAGTAWYLFNWSPGNMITVT